MCTLFQWRVSLNSQFRIAKNRALWVMYPKSAAARTTDEKPTSRYGPVHLPTLTMRMNIVPPEANPFFGYYTEVKNRTFVRICTEVQRRHMATVLIEISDSAERQHRRILRSMVEEVEGTVRIASAYVTDTGLLSDSQGRDVRLLTYISRQDIIFGATNLNSLIALINAGVKCRYLSEGPRLHAKVYMFGPKSAVVTSANLTRNALDNNLEVGVRLSGIAAAQLVTWFDTLWDASEVLDSERAKTWLQETQAEREQLSILQKTVEKQSALSTGKAKKLQNLFEGTKKVFVCNTNRRNSLNDEKSMRDRGYAVAWEKFNYPTHMDSVAAGDMICMYAKGQGIIGIGRAKGSVEKLESGAPNRVVPDGQCEWRVPTEWLVWKADRPFLWKSQNATFFDVSADKYETLREGLKRHFSEVL